MELPTPEYNKWQKHDPLQSKILALLFMVVGAALPFAAAFYIGGWPALGMLLIGVGMIGLSMICFKLATIFWAGSR